MTVDVMFSPSSQICGLATSRNEKANVRVKSSFGSSASKPSPARGRKDEVSDEQRPAHAQHDLPDGVDDGNVLAQIIYANHARLRIIKVFYAL